MLHEVGKYEHISAATSINVASDGASDGGNPVADIDVREQLKFGFFDQVFDLFCIGIHAWSPTAISARRP